MNIRTYTIIVALFTAVILDAQTIALPDSAAVVKNKIKTAKIYFKGNDGNRDLQKILTYDKKGRVTTERVNESTFYYEYSYDSKGRIIAATQRTREGALIQKTRKAYIDSNGTSIFSVFVAPDTSYAPYVYTYDKNGKKIREEQYNRLGITYIYAYKFNQEGEQIASYDSIGYQQTASFHENDLLVKRRTYSAQNKFLHEYIYRYDAYNNIQFITDSTGAMPIVHYEVVHAPGKPYTWLRDKQKLDQTENEMVTREFYYVLRTEDGQDIPLPLTDVINTHHFTYDSKGNIVRDELVQSMGSSSQTYVYEYEYEFYK